MKRDSLAELNAAVGGRVKVFYQAGSVSGFAEGELRRTQRGYGIAEPGLALLFEAGDVEGVRQAKDREGHYLIVSITALR